MITIEEVTTLKGEAGISVRKQKQIHVFNYEAELKFKATKTENNDVWTEGKIKIHQFFQDDEELEFTITIDKTSEQGPAEFPEKVKNSINS